MWLWDAATGRPHRTLEDGAAWVERVAWSPCGTLFAGAAGRADGLAAIWHPGKFKKSLAQTRVAAAVAQVAWSPDGRHLAVGSEAGHVHICGVTN